MSNLIIKDNKKMNKEGDFPSRLIVPVNNFTSTFPKLGYLGIRRKFDSNQVKYETNTMPQDSNLKEELETLQLKKKDITITNLGILVKNQSLTFQSCYPK